MATTYLQLINKVQDRLRQDRMTSLADPGATLVGHFVNQAKAEVEERGPWKALRTESPQATVSGTASYTLAGTNERSYLLYDPQGQPLAFETTSGNKHRLMVVQWEELRNLVELDSAPANSRPQYVSFNKTNAGLVAKFYPTPDAVYNYKFVVVVPQADLSGENDNLSIPSRPVWMLAAAYAAIERGEELSGEPSGLMAQANKAALDAVLGDFGADPQTYRPD